jgi:hypothetical protein
MMTTGWVTVTRPNGEAIFFKLANVRMLAAGPDRTIISWSGLGDDTLVVERPEKILAVRGSESGQD